jgi:hypothetical protein
MRASLPGRTLSSIVASMLGPSAGTSCGAVIMRMGEGATPGSSIDVTTISFT